MDKMVLLSQIKLRMMFNPHYFKAHGLPCFLYISVMKGWMKFLFYLLPFVTMLLLVQCKNRKICPTTKCQGLLLTERKLLEPGDSVDVCVASRQPWNYTRVWLSANSAYKLQVVPPGTLWCDGSLPPFTANGRKEPCHLRPTRWLLRKPDAAWFSLIGSLAKERSSYFKIGSDTTLVAPADGELIAFANDVRIHLFYRLNNRGVFVLRIKRIN